MVKKKEILTVTNTVNLTEIIVNAIQDKKGEDIVIMDMKTIHNSLFDKFIICSAQSKPQSDTIADHIAFTVKKHLGQLPNHIEGSENSEWVLIDYFSTLVHVFNSESRKYYQLEKLWADAEFTAIESH